jgi:hypothetical protein
MTPTSPSLVNRLANQPIARTVAYYLILAAAVALLYQLDPDMPGVFGTGSFPTATGRSLEAAPVANTMSMLEVVWEVLIAMVGAYLLMLPVAWIYIFTRRKRGYQQSLVQTQIVLPIVVAGVVILVKSSVALAFSLGGIVGAIAFRNRLEDTKDAVSIFLAIGVGLACGIQIMAIAAMLSIFYNLINLILWWTDFGRTPAQLEGPGAKRRLEQLRQSARRTGAFVSQVDSLILKSMTPEQLEVLTQRARKRQRNLAEQIGVTLAPQPPEPEPQPGTGPGPEKQSKKFDGELRLLLVAGADVAQVKKSVENVLQDQTKRWAFGALSSQDGRQSVTYRVKPKKSIPAPLVVEAVRRALVGRASSVELL